MPWGRIDDGLYDHPKLDRLGAHRLAGVGLWSLAISWCNRRLTDGHLPADRIRLLGGTTALADRLVDAGMFDRCAEGYRVHDFLEFNESRETVEARREADRKRKRKPNGLHPEATPDSDRSPDGNQPDSDSRDARAGGTRRASGRASRPGPSESIPRVNETDSNTAGAPSDEPPDGPVDPSDDEHPWMPA